MADFLGLRSVHTLCCLTMLATMLVTAQGKEKFEHMVITSSFPSDISSSSVLHIHFVDGDLENIFENLQNNMTLNTRAFGLNNVLSKIFSCDANYDKRKLYIFEMRSAAIISFSNVHWENTFSDMSLQTLHSGISRSVAVKLAVDWVSDNVYWVDPVFRWIGLLSGNLENVDQSNTKIIVYKDLTRPSGLAVDPVHGLIFWSDVGRVVKIERANLIGQDRATVISTGLINPMAIDVDLLSSSIYWVDPDRDTVETADFDGNNRKTLRRMSHSEFIDIVVFGNVVAVTDYSDGKMKSFNKNTGKELIKNFGPTNGDRLWSLALYNQVVQPKQTNHCLNASCSDLCVSGTSGPQCLCRDGYQLNEDTRTCQEIEGYYPRALVMADSNNICLYDIRALVSSKHIDNALCPLTKPGIKFFDIDMGERMVIFCTDNTVYSGAIEGSNPPERLTTTSQTITGLALDWRDKNIFLTTGVAGRGGIVLFSRGTHSSHMILDADLYHPRSLVLLPVDSFMIWISGGDGDSVIERAQTDGSERRVIVRAGHLTEPQSVTVDRSTNMLYWSDSGFIKRCQTDGTELETLNIDGASSPQLIHVYKNHLLFTENSGTGTVVKVTDLSVPKEVIFKFEPEGGRFVEDIKTLDTLLQPTVKGSCDVLNGGCEHICLPVGLTRICTCDYGFVLDENKETCSSTLISDNFVLVTDWTHDKIYQGSLTTDDVVAMDTNTVSNPTGVVFNYKTRQVIWGDTDNFVHRISLAGTEYEILSNTGVHGSHPDRFAIDFSTGNIYYTAVPIRDFGFAGIGVISPGGLHHTLIWRGQAPRDIVLDPEAGLLFWTDHWPKFEAVYRAAMDGSQVETIVTADIKIPNGLAVDYRAKDLYLTDGHYNTIRRCSYVGQCKVIYTAPEAFLMDIALVGDYLYFTAWNRQYISKLNKTDTADISLLAQKSELGRLDSLFVYISSQSAYPESASCSPQNNYGGCSTFCFSRPVGYTCECEDGVNLMSDDKTCENVITSTPSGPTNQTTTPTSVDKDDEPSVPVYAIAGAAAGAVVFLILLICLCRWYKRYRYNKRRPELFSNTPYDDYIQPASEGTLTSATSTDMTMVDYSDIGDVLVVDLPNKKHHKENDKRVDNPYARIPASRPRRLSGGKNRPKLELPPNAHNNTDDVNGYMSFSSQPDDGDYVSPAKPVNKLALPKLELPLSLTPPRKHKDVQQNDYLSFPPQPPNMDFLEPKTALRSTGDRNRDESTEEAYDRLSHTSRQPTPETGRHVSDPATSDPYNHLDDADKSDEDNYMHGRAIHSRQATPEVDRTARTYDHMDDRFKMDGKSLGQSINSIDPALDYISPITMISGNDVEDIDVNALERRLQLCIDSTYTHA